MVRNLDLYALVIAAEMLGQDSGAIEHAHPVCIGQHRDSASDMGVGNGIVIEVKPDVGRLGNLHLDTRIHRVGIHGQGHQAGRLSFKGLTHR